MFGIYIHWPYCLKKCPYCNFNSHLVADVDIHAWEQAFKRDLSFIHQHTNTHTPTSVFFGGGTPSLMPPELIHNILAHIAKLWGQVPPEVTLEANPVTCSQTLFHNLKHAGITRISLGIQSLNNKELSFLGRQHNRQIALNALKHALSAFNNVSCDLIYGLPNQTLAQWRHNLNEVLFFAPHHISLYQLTIEENTPFFYAVKRNAWSLPDIATQEKFLRMTWQVLTEHSLYNYEISNFALSGKECMHNKTYWLYGDYIGVGPGAHGRITKENIRYQTKCWRHPSKWLSKAQSLGHGLEMFHALTPKESVYEYVPMVLRTKTGLLWSHLEQLGKQHHHHLLHQEKIQSLTKLHFIRSTKDGISLTEKGRAIADTIAQEILA